jgi:hypothetical protein
LSDIELFCGAREALLTRDLQERLQLIGIHFRL